MHAFTMLRLTCLLILSCLLVGCGEPNRTTEPTSPRVLVLTPEQYAYGGGTLVEGLIESAGGTNAAHELLPFNQIADWQILELEPDVILFSRTWTPQQIEMWRQAPVYADVPAVRQGRLYHLDFSLADAAVDANMTEYTRIMRELIAP